MDCPPGYHEELQRDLKRFRQETYPVGTVRIVDNEYLESRTCKRCKSTIGVFLDMHGNLLTSLSPWVPPPVAPEGKATRKIAPIGQADDPVFRLSRAIGFVVKAMKLEQRLTRALRRAARIEKQQEIFERKVELRRAQLVLDLTKAKERVSELEEEKRLALK